MIVKLLQECVAACKACLEKSTALTDECRVSVKVCITACESYLEKPSPGAANVCFEEIDEVQGYLRGMSDETCKACSIACAAAAEACRQAGTLPIWRNEAERVCRYIAVDPAQFNREAKTLSVACSSEFPAFQRCNTAQAALPIYRDAGVNAGETFIEVLSHDPADVDLSMLNNRGAFLDEHKEEKQIGTVEKAELSGDKVTRATLRFGSTQLAQERFTQMSEGSRPHISAGYKHTRYLGEVDMPDGRKAKRFAWKALEVSSVAIPADPTIGVARSYKDLPTIDSQQKVIKGGETAQTVRKDNMKILLNQNPTDGGGGTATVIDDSKIKEARDLGVAEERKRRNGIQAIADNVIADRPDQAELVRSLTNEAMNKGTAVADYQLDVLTKVLKAKPVREMDPIFNGYNRKDQNRYSIIRAVRKLADKKPLDGIEKEMSDEVVRRTDLEPGGFFVPFDLAVDLGSADRGRAEVGKMQRDLNVTAFSQGGATVATNIVLPIIELLRNKMVLSKMGIITMAGLSGNVAIPRQTGAATAYSLGESATLTKSTQALDQILLAPHRVGAYNDYTKQLLIQSSIDVESFIRADLTAVTAIKWDYLGFHGQGANSEPTGIFNTPGIGAVNFAGAATFAKLVSFETALAVQNADVGRMGYVTTPATRGTWKSTAKLLTGATTVAAVALWENSGTDGEGIVNGYRALATNQILNNQVAFGNFGDVVHGLYGGYDILVNPYTRDTDAVVRITVNTFGDFAIRHAASFACSVDPGNQ